MKQEDYRRHLEVVEECDAAYAEAHADQLYRQADGDAMLEAAMDEEGVWLGPDLILRYLPAVLEDMDPALVMALLDERRDGIRSAREAVRQSMKHLELIRDHADTGTQWRLLQSLASNRTMMRDRLAALEFSKQFAKILRLYDTPRTAGIVRRIWDVMCRFRALPPALAFTAPDELPKYLDRRAIGECSDADVVRSGMVVPHRYLDPTDKGECCAAELLHETALDPDRADFGACSLLVAEDGTPIGSMKWEGYPSLLGLRSVVDARGRHVIMPGAIYKMDDALERKVLADENRNLRFGRHRPKSAGLQPVRTLGEYWDGSLEYGEYRHIIRRALQCPELANHG